MYYQIKYKTIQNSENELYDPGPGPDDFYWGLFVS